jgi:hypothetical protein
MSLDTNLKPNTITQQKRTEELEASAMHFNELAGMARNREARDFYNSLTVEEQAYLKNHQKYGWRVNAVFKMQT